MPSGARPAWCRRYVWLCLLFSLFAACGRVGVRLLPRVTGHDAGGVSDSGSSGSDAGDAGSVTLADAGPSCPTPCQNPHGSADCGSGSCVTSCSNGYQDCDGDQTNGCEASVQDTVDQCGACNVGCVNEHGTAGCEQGVCMPGCATGYADCDGMLSNGCETPLNSPTDCGGCNQTCKNDHGTASCASGVCATQCGGGFADCDGKVENGCETAIDSDPKHCGSCSGGCQFASQVCTSGSCAISTCTAGTAECDGDPTVACETDTTSSLANCGFCHNACVAANGTPACSASSCIVAGCSGGYGDCNLQPDDGCEIALNTSTANCGSCGVTCTNAHGATSCAAGTCSPICNSGYGNCDSNLRNGCELALDSATNCGMCGKVCPANGGTPGCTGGVCTTTCNLTGTYALKLSIPTTWPSTSVLSSGNGTFVFWAELQLTQSANSVSGTVWECGETVPDFDAAAFIGEHYGLTIPTTLFDGTPLPSTATSGSLSSSTPGATFSFVRSALLAGASMADPVNGAWPSASAITSVDSDGDGKVGLTVSYKSGGSYSSPPANSFGTTRAIRMYLASRVVFSLSGTLTTCTQSSGSVSAQDIDSHTLGCRVSGNSRDCNSTESNYLDSNAPNFQTAAGTYSLLKVSAGTVCSGVRAALP